MYKFNKTVASRVIEKLSENTWERLKHSFELDLSQGEETITDINLLEIRKQAVKSIRIFKCSKYAESKRGIDWDWWIGSDSLGWRRYAVQAKKLDVKKHKYHSVGHKAKGATENQMDTLKTFSSNNNAIPLYCFYNYFSRVEIASYWHCCQSAVDPPQLGCSITTLDVVRTALLLKQCNFDYIHSQTETLPWRCLAQCPQIVDPACRKRWPGIGTSTTAGNIGFYPRLPRRIRDLVSPGPEYFDSLTQREETKGLLMEAYSLVEGEQVTPRRIAVMDINDYRASHIEQ